MNVRFSNEYRKYNADLPAFLHNRPRDHVLHVSTRWTSGQDIPYGNIVQLNELTFLVCSADSHNTYRVSFGCNADMPYCECFDWQKYHWPCKHFCAIFLHFPTCGWNSLVSDYRDRLPYFSLDSDLFLHPAGIPSELLATVSEQVECVNSDDTPSAATQEDNDQTTAGRTRSVSACAKDCCESLCELTDLTYLCSDAQSLAVLHEQLQTALYTMRPHLPQEAGILLTERKEKISISTRQHSLHRNIPTHASRRSIRKAKWHKQ